MQTLNATLGCFPGRSSLRAMEIIHQSPNDFSDPVLGKIGVDHVQLCPQNCIAQVDERLIANLQASYPETQFRMHANVKVLNKHIPSADLSSFKRYQAYFKRLSALSMQLNAPAYTLHAGRRANARWPQLLAYRDQLEQLMGVPVGIEGHYPTPQREHFYWLDSWLEYQQLLEANVPYALDLSHLNIVAHYEGTIPMALVQELLNSENCIEVHVSGNQGDKDSHQRLTEKAWWMPLLEASVNSEAVFFYEGIFR